MKRAVFVLVLAACVAGGAFSQERQGYIKPTFSGGFSVVNIEGHTETLTALALDVDFVSAIGLTFGLQTAMAWNNDVGGDLFAAFGLGWTFGDTLWSAGAKIMAVPFYDGGIGINANGTWWFNENVGLSGILDLATNLGYIDWTLFSLRIGISTRI